MNGTVWNSVIITILLFLLHCDNELPTRLHPILNFELEKTNTATLVNISTSIAKQHDLYPVIDDTCRLQISYITLINGMDSLVTHDIPIVNDQTAKKEGNFSGTWTIPDSLFSYCPFRIYGCVMDETKHDVCESRFLTKDTTLSTQGNN